MTTGTSRMRPRARLLRTLGADLISSEKVAVVELVKNAYDADASVVLIKFVDALERGVGAIEFWDDGHGMDREVATQTWFSWLPPTGGSSATARP